MDTWTVGQVVRLIAGHKQETTTVPITFVYATANGNPNVNTARPSLHSSQTSSHVRPRFARSAGIEGTVAWEKQKRRERAEREETEGKRSEEGGR